MNALEQTAIDRRERLKQYRRQVQKLDKTENGEEDGENGEKEVNGTNKAIRDNNDEIIGYEEEVQGPMLKLRNYKPHDDKFIGSIEEAKKPEKIEKQIKSQLAGNDNEADNDEIGLETLQPRKVDWDLKRDLNHKLKRLEKQTSKALMQMLRDRLKPEADMDGQNQLLGENGDNQHPEESDTHNTDNNDDRITDSSGISGDRYAGMLPPQKQKGSKFK